MGIEEAGWESQEPARKTARAVIANMTEQERVSRTTDPLKHGADRRSCL